MQDIVRITRDGGRSFAVVNGADDRTCADKGGPTCSEPRCTGMIKVPARRSNLFFSVETRKSIAEADLVFIAVNTPTKSSGVGAGCATDMTAFEDATYQIARYARSGAIIVEKSTVPCRTAQFVQDTLAAHRPDIPFEILSNPEFLAAGTAMRDLMQPDRILIGSAQTSAGRRAADALTEVYAAWVPRTRIITMNVWSAELSKLVANAMLAQRISSINSISAICEETGAEIDEVAASVGSDKRIGARFLKAGSGFGGSCFKKDVLSLVYLAESLGLEHVGEYWRQVVTMNEYQRDRFSRRVIRNLNNTLRGKKITILGYTFKANTSDTRESPALDIVRMLLAENPREIAIFDPHCNPATIKREIESMFPHLDASRNDGGIVLVYSDVYKACAASNAILLTTECNEFKNTRPKVPPFPAGYKAGDCVDPRPFARHQPSETDILALHKFLLCSLPMQVHKEEDLLPWFEEEPPCAKDCVECKVINRASGGNGSGYGVGENLDWHKISYHMEKPKWVFDGKGIIEAEEMTKLGIHVESIGRQGKPRV